MQDSTLNLKLTVMGCAARHALVFAAWDDLPAGRNFVIENDHDPIPLRRQLSARAAEVGDEVEWEYLEKGPEVYRVRIGRKKHECTCGQHG